MKQKRLSGTQYCLGFIIFNDLKMIIKENNKKDRDNLFTVYEKSVKNICRPIEV